MKKLILSLGLLAGISVAAHAQTSTRFGAKAGVSLASVVGGGADVKGLVGFQGGLFANFALSDAISIQPELLYSMKGYRQEDTQTIYGVTYKVKNTSHINYIDVPILARVSSNGLFMEVGPQIGFNIAAKSNSEVTVGTSTTSSSDDFKSQTSAVDFGFAAGVGYQLSNGAGIGLRYNGGLTDVSKGNSAYSAVRNNAYQLYVSFMLGGK